jgi:hypothetical protein
MAATARPAALFILAVLLLAPPRAAAAQSCPTVYGTLMPCLGYVESGGAVPQSAACWDRPSALARINRQLLLRSIIGSCSTVGSGIDRQLWEALGRSTSHSKQRKKKINSSRDKSCAETQQRTNAVFCISLVLFYNDEYRVFL